MLDQKALEDFVDMNPLLKRPNYQRCRNIITTFPWQHSNATTFHSFILVVTSC